MKRSHLIFQTHEDVRRFQVRGMYFVLTMFSILSWSGAAFNPRTAFPLLLAMFLLPLLVRWIEVKLPPPSDAGPTELEKLGRKPKYVYPYLFLSEDGRTFLDRRWGPLYRRPNRAGKSKIWRDATGLRLELVGQLAVLRYHENTFDKKDFLEVTVVNLPEQAKNPPPLGELFLEEKGDGTTSIIQLGKEGKS